MLFSHQNLITAINSRVKEIYERRPLNDAVISRAGSVWVCDSVNVTYSSMIT